MVNIFSKKLIMAVTTAAISFVVIDTHPGRAVQLTSSDYQIEEISTGSFELIQASGLAIDSQNNIYIASNLFTGTSNLLRITPSGEVSSIAAFSDFIGGLAINETDQIFGSLFDGSIFRIDGSQVSTFASGLPQILEELTFDQNNNLFVASFMGGTVSQISPESVVTTFVSGLEGPFGVAFKNESLFIGDNLNNGGSPGAIKQVTSSGTVTDFFSPVPGRVIDLEYEPTSDSFFVANQVSVGSPIGRLEVITNGQLSTFATGFLGNPGTGFDAFPREIEFAPSGNLYVADAQKLYKISKTDSTPVPEPTAFLSTLVFGALGGLLTLTKRRRSSRKSQLKAHNCVIYHTHA